MPVKPMQFALALLVSCPLMKTIPEFKKALGPLGNQLSDTEIKELHAAANIFADAIFVQWLRKKEAEKLASTPQHEESSPPVP
jgi:hypothetical protein